MLPHKCHILVLYPHSLVNRHSDAEEGFPTIKGYAYKSVIELYTIGGNILDHLMLRTSDSLNVPEVHFRQNVTLT